MKAGKRDDLIVIERNTGSSENAFGEVAEVWTTYALAWAQVVYGSGSERREAGNERAAQTATFRLLANPQTLAVTTEDRISFNGVWDIVNVAPLDRDGVELTALRRT